MSHSGQGQWRISALDVAWLVAIPLGHHRWRTGRREESGTVTFRQQVSYFASRKVAHLHQIEFLRDKWVGK